MNNYLLPALSESREGDFVRVVCRKDHANRIGIELEGGGPGGERHRERIAAALKAERFDGVEFESCSTERQRDSRDLTGSLLEILPRARRLRSKSKQLGFGPPACKDAPVSRLKPIFVPDYRTLDRINSLGVIQTLIESRTVSHAEIELVRWTLPSGWTASLENSRSNRSEFDSSTRTGAEKRLSDFLDAWLKHRAGWSVRFRIGEEVNGSAERALWQLAGTSLFGSPCKIRPAFRFPHDPRSVLDLSTCFPENCEFPELLSLEGWTDRLDVRKEYHSIAPLVPSGGIPVGKVRGQTVSLPESTRDRHTYIAGATGTGKSTLIKKLISHDLDRYDSLVLLDPHGDLYREVIDMVPDRRRSDLFVIDPASAGPPPPFNIMRIPRDRFYRRRVEFLIGELIRFFRETWQVSEAFGPMFEIYFRNGMLLLLLQDRVPVTVLDFLRVFSDDDFRTRLATVCSADDVKTFWRKTAKQTSGEVSLANIAPYIVSKMSVFNHGGFITDMMGQHEDEVRLESRINSGGIVLVNLDKGVLGPSESRLLGVLLTMQLFTAGLKRSLVPPTQRRPVNIYIDEFQNFVSDNVASMLSEARKFGLRLHLANQTLSQLSSGSGGQNLLESVLGNVGNLILFRLGVTDAMRLEPHLEPFSRHQVQELRNFHALARILTEDGPLCPLIMETLP